jgi:hypothetical protein
MLGFWLPVQGKQASFSARRNREDVLGHGGEGSWRFAQGPIEHRAKRRTVLLRDLRAVSLFLRAEKTCLLDCQRREVPDGRRRPRGEPLVPKRGSSDLFGCAQSAALGASPSFICVKVFLPCRATNPQRGPTPGRKWQPPDLALAMSGQSAFREQSVEARTTNSASAVSSTTQVGPHQPIDRPPLETPPK